ncbi:MAG: hypothetical protein RIT14_1150 [Pseudomonadota bacterium]|jgi:hypothetical protein
MIRRRLLSPFLSLVLAWLLALGFAGMAMARVQAAGVTEMVICAGGQMGTVTLDARGAPVERPHHCPDCAPMAAALPLPSSPAERPQTRRARLRRVARRRFWRAVALVPLARGPPGRV